MRKENGITLIALVITIVILIILAGVTISLSIGENGIFNKTKYGKEMYLNEQVTEEKNINSLSDEIETITENNKFRKIRSNCKSRK